MFASLSDHARLYAGRARLDQVAASPAAIITQHTLFALPGFAKQRPETGVQFITLWVPDIGYANFGKRINPCHSPILLNGKF